MPQNFLACDREQELLLPPSTEEVRVYLFETEERYKRYMQSKYPELPSRRAFFIANPSGLGSSGKELAATLRASANVTSRPRRSS